MLTAHMATMQSPTISTMNRTGALKRMKYDDYQIWRIVPSTHAHLEFLREFKESDDSQNVLWLKGPAMRLFTSFYFNFFFLYSRSNSIIIPILIFFVIFRGPNDILVPPELNKEIQEILEYESIPFEVVVWDLEKAIKYENPIMSRRQKIELEKEQGRKWNFSYPSLALSFSNLIFNNFFNFFSTDPMTWYRYHNFEDIAIYLDYLQLTYPDLVELIHIGRSFEGRPLMVAKVTSK